MEKLKEIFGKFEKKRKGMIAGIGMLLLYIVGGFGLAALVSTIVKTIFPLIGIPSMAPIILLLVYAMLYGLLAMFVPASIPFVIGAVGITILTLIIGLLNGTSILNVTRVIFI